MVSDPESLRAGPGDIPWDQTRVLADYVKDRGESKKRGVLVRGLGIDSLKNAMSSEIDALLLTGRVSTMGEAEGMFLGGHLEVITDIAERLTDEEFGPRELVRLLLAHGSRPWENSL